MELPPRARRIRQLGAHSIFPLGTTSACAENTHARGYHHARTGNYLRVRGEYSPGNVWYRSMAELPPRARRIHGARAILLTLRGTTSACAENTAPPHRGNPPLRNYLRVRGEYLSKIPREPHHGELPPRARRIPGKVVGMAGAGGTTSACAENTISNVVSKRCNRNYLRVRGEYLLVLQNGALQGELPPRARRILDADCELFIFDGTTSACAENTDFGAGASLATRNYLRVRGEYLNSPSKTPYQGELPPRARRIRQKDKERKDHHGTTSACAENTFSHH